MLGVEDRCVKLFKPSTYLCVTDKVSFVKNVPGLQLPLNQDDLLVCAETY